MKITLSNQARLEADKSILDKIEKALTYPNPKHAEAIKHGRSTRGINRLINLSSKADDGSLIVPAGALTQLHTTGSQIDDRRVSHPAVIKTTIDTRPYQERAILNALCYENGVIVAPTGAGKTTMGIEIASRLNQRCLILVKSKDLAEQWIGAIKKFTGLDCGVIGGGKWLEGEQFTVATVQTLIKHEDSLDYGLLIVDECHNVPAKQAYADQKPRVARNARLHGRIWHDASQPRQSPERTSARTKRPIRRRQTKPWQILWRQQPWMMGNYFLM